MLVGVPKEIKDNEYRVGLVPSTVRELTDRGHQVLVETGAGAGAGLPDSDYEAAGGLIVADAYGAHMHCPAPEHRLPAPTRKSMTVRFAMAAAQRINRLVDPQGHEEI